MRRTRNAFAQCVKRERMWRAAAAAARVDRKHNEMPFQLDCVLCVLCGGYSLQNTTQHSTAQYTLDNICRVTLEHLQRICRSGN